MKKRIALVTGSSRGIGRAIVIELAKRGVNVVINYVNSEASANELKKYVMDTYGVVAETYKCDVSNEYSVKEMIDFTVDKFGRIDYVVNNAGIALDCTLEDKTKSNFIRTLDVNLIGTFLVCKYAAKYMKENKFGRIVNISSTNGIDTFYEESIDYDASKAAVINLTKNLAKAYAPYILVNSVAPGWVNTEMNMELDVDFIKKEEDKIFLRRFAEPNEIAKVVAFLLSDDASYITGETIRVDGGY